MQKPKGEEWTTTESSSEAPKLELRNKLYFNGFCAILSLIPGHSDIPAWLEDSENVVKGIGN